MYRWADVSPADPLPLQLVLLGSICVGLNTLVDVIAVFAAERLLHSSSARELRARMLTRVSGCTMIGLGAYLALEIKRYTGEIRDTQKLAETPEDKVAAYADNLKKLDIINKDIEQLKRLAEAIDKAKVKKVSEIIKTVTPDVATTWKLIYATIAFLVVVALSFLFFPEL